jgi:hypothetical protein
MSRRIESRLRLGGLNSAQSGIAQRRASIAMDPPHAASRALAVSNPGKEPIQSTRLVLLVAYYQSISVLGTLGRRIVRTPTNIRRSSGGAAVTCCWVRAMCERRLILSDGSDRVSELFSMEHTVIVDLLFNGDDWKMAYPLRACNSGP